MLLRTSLVLLTVTTAAACGPKASTAGGEVDNGGGTAPSGPPYAAMFEAGRSWTFQYETRSSYWDDSNPQANADGMVDDTASGQATCSVAQVAEYSGGKLAEIKCDDGWPMDAGRDPLTGAWATSERGLYRVQDWPEGDGEPILADEMFVMAAAPVAETRPEYDPEYGEDPISETSISNEGDTWCWSESGMMGDAYWWSMCLGPQGPTKGNFGWSGGSDHEATFTLVP